MKRVYLPAAVMLIVCIVCLLPDGAPATENDACLQCHETGSKQSTFHVEGSVFDSSIHGQEGVSCVDCHQEAGDEAHRKNETVTPVSCEECHSQENLHGAGKNGAPNCASCHGDHDVFSVSYARSHVHPSKLKTTCGECHPLQAGKGGFPASLLSYRIKGHAKGNMAGGYTEDRCIDCHQGRGAHGDDELITQADCGGCHTPNTTADAVLGSIHGRNSESSLVFGDLLYLALLVIFLVIFLGGWTRRIQLWRSGKAENRWDRHWERIRGWIDYALFQKKVFRRKSAGNSHILLFIGFVIPFIVVIIIQFGVTASLPVGAVLSFLLDITGLAFLIGIIGAFTRRGKNPQEFPTSEKGTVAGLVLLGLICISGFMVEGLRLSTTGNLTWAAPVGDLFSFVLPASASGTKFLWRIHLLLVLSFLAISPFTRIRHVITAPLNIYFRNLQPMGKLATIRVDTGDCFGTASARDISWKGLLDADACLACGRCREVCPANQAQKPLSPMKVIQDLQNHMQAVNTRHGGNNRSLIDNWITEEEIWACTTCGACMDSCPVLIEHVDKVVGMRRALVLNEGRAPLEAKRLLRNLEVYGDPAGEGRAFRRDWMFDLDEKIITGNTDNHTVIWIGCQGAFHPRIRNVAKALVEIAARAGQKVSLLGEKETCCGDPARRLGQEDLFQNLAKQNIEMFKANGVNTIVTICPHCYNTMANEYADFSPDFNVMTASQWIVDIFSQNALPIKRSFDQKITFHDPCYLSRINGQFEIPRKIFTMISGLELVEAEKNRRETFCCGAGGGRMWLHETGTRINQLRARQCAETGTETIVTACPYCITMLEDGLSSLEGEKEKRVMDVVEIVEWVTR